MAIQVKKTTDGKGTTAAELLATFQKNMGKTVGSYGGALVNSSRLPTGIFPFDLASGGGLPRGRCSIIYGPESSNKTNFVLKLIAMHQKLFQETTCVFIDIEGGFDPDWATLLGVDVPRLIVVRPSYAEQAVDMVESFLYAEDCGLVAIDSLAAMVTTQEIENSAEKAVVGGSSNPIGKMVRKSTLALIEAEKQGRSPMLIYVNQTRFKIGVMFGDPESMPGGNAPKFQAAFWLRLYGKNKIDPKISKVMPVLKEVNFVVKKWKVPIFSPIGKFEMAMLPHAGLEVGECDDWNSVSSYLKDLDQFAKDGTKGWLILGDKYPTIETFKTRLYEDKDFGREVRAALIARILADGTMATGEIT